MAKQREKVIRFYSPWCKKSFKRLEEENIVFGDGVTSIEICTSYKEPLTVTYTPDNSDKKFSEKWEDGWKKLDPKKDYYFVAEAWWRNSANKPWDDIELTKQMRNSPLPVSLFEAMQSKNVITVALWDQWGDGETLDEAVKELKGKGFKKVYNLGKYRDSDPVGSYVELQDGSIYSVQGPRIGLKEKPVPEPEPEPPKEVEEKVSAVILGDWKLLDGAVLSSITNRYCGWTITVVKGKGSEGEINVRLQPPKKTKKLNKPSKPSKQKTDEE